MKTVLLRFLIALIWVIVSGYQMYQGSISWAMFSLLIALIFVYSGWKEKGRMKHD